VDVAGAFGAVPDVEPAAAFGALPRKVPPKRLVADWNAVEAPGAEEEAGA
jgi:hypothetical protein